LYIIKEDKMARAYNTQEEEYIGFWWENQKERDK
jgi:hypothetical protein